MKMIMSGHRYAVSAPGLFVALWSSLMKRGAPLSVLTNKITAQNYAIPLPLEDELHALGENYVSCERNLVWPDREPVFQLRRASACCDLIGEALEQAINGDTARLAELTALSSENLASQIDQKLAVLKDGV